MSLFKNQASPRAGSDASYYQQRQQSGNNGSSWGNLYANAKQKAGSLNPYMDAISQQADYGYKDRTYSAPLDSVYHNMTPRGQSWQSYDRHAPLIRGTAVARNYSGRSGGYDPYRRTEGRIRNTPSNTPTASWWDKEGPGAAQKYQEYRQQFGSPNSFPDRIAEGDYNKMKHMEQIGALEQERIRNSYNRGRMSSGAYPNRDDRRGYAG